MLRAKHSSALLITCLLYTSFVIYGSLVPLDFVYLPWNEALIKFQNIRYLNLGVGSRADWVANILLFIPLTFLWAAFFHQRSDSFHYFIALVILFLAATLSISIEFTQLFFPQRTVSRNDIIAEITGAIAGIATWRLYGQHFNLWLKRWTTNRGSAGRYEQLLYIYIAILFGYNLLPLDLTNSPVEIYHKWVGGKIHIIPFFSSFENGVSNFLYGIFVDIIIWAPVPFLWILSAKKTLAQAFKWSWLSALLLEFLQLFVYSRVSDSADLITAALGSGLGVYIASKFHPLTENKIAPEQAAITGTGKAPGIPAIPLCLVAGWSAILLLIFWFPYDFQTDPQLIKERLPQLFGAPFSAYYYGTEFRAITSLLSKLAFFFPLGALLAHLKMALPKSWPSSLITTCLILFLIGMASIIEFGQVLLPLKSIDSADIFVAIAGGLIGFSSYQFVTAGHTSINTTPAIRTRSAISEHRGSSRQGRPPALSKKTPHQEVFQQAHLLSSPWLLPAQCLTVVLSFYLIENIAAIPYNVRELIATSNLLERILFSFALFLSVWPQLYSTRAYCLNRLTGKRFAAIMAIQPFILYGLLRLSVPLESIHDIVGYPVISTTGGLESLFRFVALFSLPSWALIGGIIILFHRSANRLLLWALFGAIIIVTWHWLVVRFAATDNLTELFLDGGNWQSTIWLACWFICFATTLLTTLKIISGNSKHWLIALLAIAISFPLSYWLISQALEIVIIKYGQVFSGLQFLLSPDRDHLVAEQNIMSRYFLAYFTLLFGASWLGLSALSCQFHRAQTTKIDTQTGQLKI